MIAIDRDRLLDDLRELARFGKVETGVNRLALTSEDVAARKWLAGRMADAGLDARIDGLGNVYGQSPGVSQAILIGSHTDTVPKGGWLDGALGVIYGLEIARAFFASGGRGRDTGVDVISFIDEEGHFHGTTGSLSFCGEFSLDDKGSVTNAKGVTLREAIREAGFAGAPLATLDPRRHCAFLEAHIEQGPRLENEGRKIGIVTGIVGIRRTVVTFRGQADHAGTTPMALRRDAGGALFDFIHDLCQRFATIAGENTVWNFGDVSVLPGAPNVVANEARVTVEYRDLSAGILDAMDGAIKAVLHAVTDAGKIEADARFGLRIAAAEMAANVQDAIDRASGLCGVEALRMPSGAGHDAMILARHLPCGMLFIPSIGGRSHDVSEDTREEDIVLGAEVLAKAVEHLMAANP